VLVRNLQENSLQIHLIDLNLGPARGARCRLCWRFTLVGVHLPPLDDQPPHMDRRGKEFLEIVLQ